MNEFNPFGYMENTSNGNEEKGYGETIASVVTPEKLEGTNSSLKLVPLPWICVKRENNYGSNEREMKVLRNEIEKDGQRTPIKIYSIDGLLELDSLGDNDRKYYQDMKKKGCHYFVNEGHRRFKAVMSLALDKDIVYDDQTYGEYKRLNEIYQDYEKENLSLKKSNPWIVIKAEICSDYENTEWGANDNLFQRNEIKEFEVYYNVIDLMKADGTYAKAQEIAKNEYIKSMTDRAVKDHLSLLVKTGKLDSKEFDDCDDSQKKYRELLAKQDFDNLPNRINKSFTNTLSAAIFERTGREVSSSWINKIDNFINVFDKKIIKEIVNGNISMRNAQALLPIYEKGLLDEEKIEKIVEEARKGQFSIDNYIEPKKKNNKKKYKKKITYSAKDVLKILEEIKYKTSTLDEVYERIKKQV